MNKERSVKTYSAFDDALKLMIKRHQDISELNKVIKMLRSDQVLPMKYHDHKLNCSKKYKECRECHIKPDWLLVYKKTKDMLLLYLVDMGSHSDLFK